MLEWDDNGIEDTLITEIDDQDNIEDIIEENDLELDLVEVTVHELEMHKKKR